MNTRLLLLASVTALLGCQPIAPGAARYSCSQDLPVETQCATGWRCGLDGFCFNPDGPNPVTLSCEDTARDCPTGWRCGLSGTCFDPANPGAAALPCKNPANDCPTGFKCSLEGLCFDPANPTAAALPCKDPAIDCPTGYKCGLDARCLAPTVPGPWRCEDTARDCTGGWTCGALSLCFDRADAGRVACRDGVATDCSDGWRCGIDGLCQQRDAGAPWPCRDDSHCEAAWRCSPEGSCLDPSLDALRPNDGMPLGAAFDFGWGTTLPDEVVINDEVQKSGCGPAAPVSAWVGAARFGPRVELFSASAWGSLGLPSSCDAGVPSQATAQLLRGTVQLPNDTARSLGVLDDGVVAVLGDAGVSFFQLAGDQQVVALNKVPGSFKRLRSYRGRGEVLAISDSEVWSFTSAFAGGRMNQQPMRAVDGGIAVISDAILLEVNGEELAVAATNLGLFARSLTATDSGVPWQHVVWTEPSMNFRELRATVGNGNNDPVLTASVEAATPGPQTSRARLWTFNLLADPTGSSFFSAPYTVAWDSLPGAGRPFAFRWVPDQVSCPDAIRGWVRTGGLPVHQTLLQCVSADGGVSVHHYRTGTSPIIRELAPAEEQAPFTRDARWLANNEASVLLVDPRGALSVLSEHRNDWPGLRPWTPLSSPEAVTGHLSGVVIARTGRGEFKLGTAATFATSAPTQFATTADGGLLRLDERLNASGETYRLFAGVEGQPGLSVLQLSGDRDYTTLLVQADDAGVIGRRRTTPLKVLAKTTVPTSPMASSLAATADGGLWFASVEDRLYVAETGPSYPVSAQNVAVTNDLAAVPRARLAVTPLPNAVITHVLALPPAATGDATYGQALVVVAGRLFHVGAQNPVVWRATEPLDTPYEVIKSWADGTRVRVGARNGQVFSFPSRVALSVPFNASLSVRDYVDVCGVTYALTNDGLYRLAVQPGVPIGTWVSVRLPMSFDTSTGGRLYTDGTGLLAFDARGAVVNVTGLTCAQPL